MKKILILIALFSGILAAQNWTPQKNSVSTFSNYGVMKADTMTATSVFDVNSNRITIKLDTMATGDTTSIMYFGNQYDDCFITLYDSLGKLTSDTFYVERYDTLAPQASKAWTSVQVQFVDISTNNYTSSVTGRYGYSGANVITPGAGLTKTYYIMEPRPGTYRVFVNTVDVYNNKKKYVKWTGKNR